MTWLIPENHLDEISYKIIDCPIQEGNICICGSIKTGKTTILLHILKKILRTKANPCIVILVYRNIDVNRFETIFHELGINTIVMTYWKFKKSSSRYDYILCEDVHLIGADWLLQIKDRSNRVIVTINPRLVLFDNSFTQTSLLTIDQVRDILNPKVFTLCHSHQCNNPIVLKLEELLLNSDNPIQNTFFSHTRQTVRLCEASNTKEELHFVIDEAEKYRIRGYSVAVLIPTNTGILKFVQGIIALKNEKEWDETTNCWGRIDFENLNRYLSGINLNYQCLGSNFGMLSEIDNRINIMTYHASMGFEYDYIFMPFVNSDLFISINETIQKSAFVLASTRSRIGLNYTYSGPKLHYLNFIENDCKKLILMII